MEHSSAQIVEEPYETEINKEKSSWRITLSNGAEMEEGDFDIRLYDYLEDMEIWLELDCIKEEERINPVNYGEKLTWNTTRGSYKSEESMRFWGLNELCQRDWGAVYLEGGISDGKYYKVERGVMQSMATEMVCFASARLEWQNIMRYG